MTAETDVSVPERLMNRPGDDHGRVYAWSLGLDENGKPMHGTNDVRKVARCILDRLCGICGEPLDYWIVFVGDENCVKRRGFMEAPMHEECARYSLTVCPYLRGEEGFEVKRERDGVQVVADRSRPARMAMYVTRGFDPLFDSVVPMARAQAPKRLEWF